MKQKIDTFIMGILTLFSIYLYHLSASPISPTIEIKKTPLIQVVTEEKKALNYLNELRQGAGLVPFKSQKELKLAAKSHADYLTNHLTYGHREEAKYSDFTGEYGSSRVMHYGYSAPQVIENVSVNNKNYKESIDGLFSAIYHRMAFLDFRVNTIGIGVSQNLQHQEHTAFVYDMSSDALEKLYRSKKKITNKNLDKALNCNKQNSSIILFPFNQQKNVPPAFFNELPDPLPTYDVSGYPISISFNPQVYKNVKLLSFKIFESDSNEITDTIQYDFKSDPNQRLEKFDFVLFPLKRLKWNHHYVVKTLANVDNRLLEKRWEFYTQKFNLPFHRVTNQNEEFNIRERESHIFYFPPISKNDLLKDISYPSNFDIEFIDKNTIKLTAIEAIDKLQKLTIGDHSIVVKVVALK